MNIFSALKYGKSLKDVEWWKHAQMTLIMVMGLLPIFLPEIDMSLLVKIDSAITVVIAYLTVATTTKIGV